MDQDHRIIYTSREVAERFRVTLPTLARWIRLGKITPSFRTPNGHPRFYADEIDAKASWPKDGAGQ